MACVCESFANFQQLPNIKQLLMQTCIRTRTRTHTRTHKSRQYLCISGQRTDVPVINFQMRCVSRGTGFGFGFGVKPCPGQLCRFHILVKTEYERQDAEMQGCRDGRTAGLLGCRIAAQPVGGSATRPLGYVFAATRSESCALAEIEIQIHSFCIFACICLSVLPARQILAPN